MRNQDVTQAEIEFIRKLGQWANTDLTHEQLVRKYRHALENRSVWNDIDKDAVFGCLLVEMAKA